ncbi:hypothetical protein [Geodermatophilus poikilotrophus]|uniref:hypothetical protein n=1 Tax=Geodermatophilus poikilotrophus TaxID=1333667 RepID=UPI000B8802A3|nr:hypothetical protein [Geodermatophilus poikilotrophus]
MSEDDDRMQLPRRGRCSGHQDRLVQLLRQSQARHPDRLVVLGGHVEVDQRPPAHQGEGHQPVLDAGVVDEDRCVVTDTQVDGHLPDGAALVLKGDRLDAAQDPHPEVQLGEQHPAAHFGAEGGR